MRRVAAMAWFALAGCVAHSGAPAADGPSPAGARVAPAAAAPASGPERTRPAGTSFRDCAECPEMVVLPPGRYTMGSTEEDRRRLGVLPMFDRMETPLHEVTIGRAFAVGKFSVTFAEWDACVADGGCGGYVPDDAGWGRGRRPVINVNFADAQAYVAWLRAKTGRPYRLLSEAEWEYAARAGTTTAFSWGTVPDESRANFGKTRGRTLEVGSFPANAFGLHDMGGNSAQWVADCHHESYDGAPADGSAWLTGDCRLRNVRGSGWSLSPWTVRTAQRIGDPPAQRNDHLGFRIARDLPR